MIYTTVTLRKAWFPLDRCHSYNDNIWDISGNALLATPTGTTFGDGLDSYTEGAMEFTSIDTYLTIDMTGELDLQ